MLKYLAAILLFVFPIIGQSGNGYKKVKIDKVVQFEVPLDFTELNERELREKLAAARPPLAFYSDQLRNADFIVNYVSTLWIDNDLSVLKEFQKSNLRQLFSEINFINESIRTINKQKVIYLEFIGLLAGDEESVVNTSGKRNYYQMAFAVINNKTLVFTFTCPIYLKDEYEKKASHIINSIKIKKTL